MGKNPTRKEYQLDQEKLNMLDRNDYTQYLHLEDLEDIKLPEAPKFDDSKYRAHWNPNAPKREDCITIVNDLNESFRLATYGNFSVVTGQAKSRKSFFVQCLASAFLNNETQPLQKIKGHAKEDKFNLLYFDTEQEEGTDVNELMNRVYQMSGRTPDQLPNFRCYPLRSVKTEDRYQTIKNYILGVENVGLVIIDGIKDLLKSINNEESATNLTDDLLQWTAKVKCHIVCVLHENKNSETARGHIGTELINKAESVISIRKSDDNSMSSEIVPTFTRGKEFQNFAFTISESGIPILDDDFGLKEQSKSGAKKKIDFNNLTKVEIHEILNFVFKERNELSWVELLDRLQGGVEKVLEPITIGNQKTKEFLRYLKGRELIKNLDPDSQKSKLIRA
jgi:hypothetical protein